MTPVQRALRREHDIHLTVLPGSYRAGHSVAELARRMRLPLRIVRRVIVEHGLELRPEDAGPKASVAALLDYLNATRAERKRRLRAEEEADRRLLDALEAEGRLIRPTKPKGPPPKPLRIPGLRLSDYVLEMRGR